MCAFPAVLIEFRPWDKIRDWSVKQKVDEIKKYCAEIHKRAGNGTIIVKDVLLTESTLSFTQSKYEPRDIDVLQYSSDNGTEDRTYEYYVYKLSLIHI